MLNAQASPFSEKSGLAATIGARLWLKPLTGTGTGATGSRVCYSRLRAPPHAGAGALPTADEKLARLLQVADENIGAALKKCAARHRSRPSAYDARCGLMPSCRARRVPADSTRARRILAPRWHRLRLRATRHHARPSTARARMCMHVRPPSPRAAGTSSTRSWARRSTSSPRSTSASTRAWSKWCLGGAIAGHHGLVRLHLKAWGCPPHT